MKYRNILFLFLVVIFGIILSSCEPQQIASKYETISIEDDIKTETEWSGDKIYLIKKTDFRVENVLTIHPGAIIKFTANAGDVTVSRTGKIIARGISSNPIIFTSVKDDDNGGDSNDDGGNTSAAKGDWNGISLTNTVGSEFVYCEFLYGGKNDELKRSSTLDITDNSSAVVKNCTFAYNGGKFDANTCRAALRAVNADVENTIIANNTFHSNDLPLAIYTEQSIDNSNKFSDAGKLNKYNGIFVEGLVINKNVTWTENEVAFVITANNLSVFLGNTLTLSNNVVLKFLEGATLNLENGEEALINHDAHGVYFTSFKDDEHGGDSNGNNNADENILTDSYYDWNGIFTGGQKNNDYAQWLNILYASSRPIAK
ncbi:hypothetical protein LJC11_01920 [Bacteroidales bacterium OttesenSCG-928-I21]|nr:hypothetical protein [Bacteroidales bacterium OttesenSCG-928-I21]